MTYIFPAVFSPIEDGSGYYARVPDLPGCVTTGNTLHDAIAQITDAMSGWLCVAEDEGVPIPEPSIRRQPALESGELSSLIEADTLRYRALTDTHAVRKNVSLPAWMVTLADRRGINCSQLLQDALREKLGVSF